MTPVTPRNRRGKGWLVAAGCAVALVTASLAPATPAAAAGTSIASAQVQVQFDTSNGLPSQYTFPAWSNARLRGHDLDGGSLEQLTAVSRDSAKAEFSGTNSLRLNRIETPSATRAKVYYDAYWSDGTTRTASLAIQYDVSGHNVDITLQDVVETSGYQLIAVNLPSLLSLRQEDGGSPWILDANGGGRLNTLANAGPGSQKKIDFNGTESPYLPVNAVGTSGATGGLEITGYVDQPYTSVYTSGSNKHYTAGVGAQYRVRGGATTENLLVNQSQIAKLTFAGDYDGNGAVDWLDLAKAMRDQAPPIPSHYYDDKYVYMLQNQVGRHGVDLTFDEAQKWSGRISNLIDGNPQVMQLVGMFNPGHDTAEPNWTAVNPGLGGPAGLKALQANAQNLYNTNVTFDDNYDDQYNNEYSCNPQVPSACYNQADISRTVDNQLKTFNAWNGTDVSYIAGLKKYVDSGRALERVRGTITSYGLHDATLIDALSTYSVLRSDWDPAHPASAVDGLTGGRFKIMDEYARYGIDVNSENQQYPMLGKMSLAVDGPEGGGWVGGTDTEVPFMATVLRHSVIYGGKNGTATSGGMALDVDPRTMLLNNNRSARWIKPGAADTDIADSYYLVHRPWMLLSKLDVDTFSRSDDGKSVTETLKDGSGNTASIDIDYRNDTFKAVYNGTKIMDGYSVTVPMDSNRIAFYSRTDQKL
ncbi:hypothetical protein, partial [Streptomyces sp. NRRL WC-3742]|uniref:hypothetical protein n=1 Tax=Streptomyces sp. NRRL WC-3742 TaxID=1463934 RepID=UPI00131CE5BA